MTQLLVQQLHPTGELKRFGSLHVWHPRVFINLFIYLTAFKSLCACVLTEQKSKTYQDPGKLLLFHPSGPCRQRSSCLCCLALPLGWTRPPLATRIWSFLRWRSLECLGPPRASSVSSASVAGVALLLCANSALIQKLFYAVKRTCDRQRGGGRGGKEWGRGKQDNTF